MTETKLTLRDKGPILVSGNFVVEDGAGNQIDLQGKTTIALCRCGHSKNSPFCDGTHKECQFEVINRA
ncbi:MAG: CDGSH iron-sulfur domain-containing protein, partial [Planctomycetaceae bacterium]|nr:CDGSH iron-sulfur domain-containing protein [Planctomycetaceae bacterium]